MNLNELVKTVSYEDFGKPFRHKAVWNKRLKTTGGRFHPKDGHLDFNPKHYEVFGEEVFRKIIRHELCHYHLFFEKKGYRHKDRDFKELLEKVGGIRYAPGLPSTSRYQYNCQNCGQVYYRQRRINLTTYVCGKCCGKLLLV